MLGVTFATSTGMLFASALVFGFFIVAVLPLGMQYAAEISHPTPEGTSSGLIQLCGQVSVVFVYVMAALRTANGSYTVSLLLSAALLIAGAVVVSRLKDTGPAAAEAAAAPPPAAEQQPAG